eukprot:s542_g3.t1
MDAAGPLEPSDGDLPAPSTPRRLARGAEETRHWDDSPERTPGPGEGSPIDAPGADLLLEASARSNRRVLEGLRISRIPPPLPGHMRRQSAWGSPGSEQVLPESPSSEGVERERASPPTDSTRNEDRASAWDFRTSHSREIKPWQWWNTAGAAACTTADASTRRSTCRQLHPFAADPRHGPHWRMGWGLLMRAPEPGQASFARTVEAFQLEAQEARDALGRSEAERSLQEGQAAKREADLRHEIIDLRSAQSRERERLRSEAKRLQASLKDAHVRLKVLGAAGFQVETNRQVMANVPKDELTKEQQDELLCTYAALILHDDGAEITPVAMTNLIKAAGCSVEGYWPMLMTKMISNVGMEQLIKLGSGAGGGGGGGGGAAAGGGGAAAGGGDAGGAAEEKKKVEEEEEEELPQ